MYMGECEGRQVELGFELDPRRLSGRVAKLLRSAREIVVELAIGDGKSRATARVGYEWSAFEMKVDGVLRCSL